VELPLAHNPTDAFTLFENKRRRSRNVNAMLNNASKFSNRGQEEHSLDRRSSHLTDRSGLSQSTIRFFDEDRFVFTTFPICIEGKVARFGYLPE
jgi:hypothetical protein